jgi:hypothetical protein
MKMLNTQGFWVHNITYIIGIILNICLIIHIVLSFCKKWLFPKEKLFLLYLRYFHIGQAPTPGGRSRTPPGQSNGYPPPAIFFKKVIFLVESFLIVQKHGKHGLIGI